MSLTPQQELFAQHVASGKSQAEAYRIAYPKSAAWTAQAVANQAHKLMGNPDIPPRIQAIRDELAERGLWSREQSVRVLAEIASGGEKDADRVRAVAELNKMHGFEAPVKVEHSGSITQVTRRIVDAKAENV